MDITKDIQPMTAFRNNSAKFMRHLRETKRPVILTVNGKAAAARTVLATLPEAQRAALVLRYRTEAQLVPAYIRSVERWLAAAPR